MMERPLLPWRHQKTTLLFSATFFCSFMGTVIVPVEIPLHQVNGVLRRSVLLSVNDISSSEKVSRVEWEFHPQNGKGSIMAEFKDGKLERPDPGDRFGARLEWTNKTTLRIQALEKEDSGVYRMRIRLHPAGIEERAFQLKVYDPVPEPQILLFQENFDSSSGCNVTLQCSVSKKGGLNVSWRIGNAIEPLEGGLDWYRLSSEGWSLHLSNLSNPMDPRVTCLVSNPADRKSASVNLTNTCSHPDSKQILWWLVFPFAIVFVLTAGLWIWKKRRKQPCFSKDSAEHSALEADNVPEVQYMEVQNVRSPSKGDNDQELGRLSKGSPVAGSPTIYAVVHGPASLSPS